MIKITKSNTKHKLINSFFWWCSLLFRFFTCPLMLINDKALHFLCNWTLFKHLLNFPGMIGVLFEDTILETRKLFFVVLNKEVHLLISIRPSIIFCFLSECFISSFHLSDLSLSLFLRFNLLISNKSSLKIGLLRFLIIKILFCVEVVAGLDNFFKSFKLNVLKNIGRSNESKWFRYVWIVMR